MDIKSNRNKNLSCFSVNLGGIILTVKVTLYIYLKRFPKFGLFD